MLSPIIPISPSNTLLAVAIVPPRITVSKFAIACALRHKIEAVSLGCQQEGAKRDAAPFCCRSIEDFALVHIGVHASHFFGIAII